MSKTKETIKELNDLKIFQKKLSIDIETYSATDLTKSGVYRYTKDPSFEIMLFAYAIDDSEVQVIDLINGETLPDFILYALTSPDVLKTAFNANFEMLCISKHFRLPIDPAQWECTMVRSAMCGLPLSLKMVGEVLKLDTQKMDVGKSLIRYFSMPCKPTRANGNRTRNLYYHDEDKWGLFKEYCRQDVETERAVYNKLELYYIPPKEKELWNLDQKINNTGIMTDALFIENAIKIDVEYRKELTEEIKNLTGLDNPNSVAQLKEYLGVDSLTKEAVKDMLEETDCPDTTRVLEIRQEMAKTSVKKYEAMWNAMCDDGRVRGLLQYYGANRTGRFAGRLVQVQNLPQNHLPDLDLARSLVRNHDIDSLKLLYGNVPQVLSELIRTAFVAEKGGTFAVADFSAIEARVIAWLAGEKWRLDVFASHGKIYEASASQMFKVPIEEIDKGSPLRQKGKVAELALGYQGSVGAMTAMGALKMGLDEHELQPIVDAWRAANPAIVKLWYDIEKAAITAIETGECVFFNKGIKFYVRKGMLSINLPSDRRLSYVRPRLIENRFGRKAIQYESMEQATNKWGKTDTYGGKLTENIVQAIARDCLAEAMLRLDKAGYRIVMHVHDEVVVELPPNLLKKEQETALNEICKIMSEPIHWAKGLQLTADGYLTEYYKKD